MAPNFYLWQLNFEPSERENLPNREKKVEGPAGEDETARERGGRRGRVSSITRETRGIARTAFCNVARLHEQPFFGGVLLADARLKADYGDKGGAGRGVAGNKERERRRKGWKSG